MLLVVTHYALVGTYPVMRSTGTGTHPLGGIPMGIGTLYHGYRDPLPQDTGPLIPGSGPLIPGSGPLIPGSETLIQEMGSIMGYIEVGKWEETGAIMTPFNDPF
jgi:hypothetical protein